MAVPMVALYGVAVAITSWSDRRRARRRALNS
jgi:Sec-independent protein secretion pathway component TatC